MKTLYILGAGASRGHGVARYPKPPTVREFFHDRFMSKLGNKYGHLLPTLHQALEHSGTSLASVNVEELFSMVEPVWELGVLGKEIKSVDDEMPTADDFVNPLDMLRSWVVDVIHLSTGWLRQTTCPYHQELARRAVAHNDTIITFNYDLIMDLALQNTGSWSVKTGYGWNSHGKELWFGSNHGYESTPTDTESCLLLKPHGSINFFRSSRFNEWMKGREGIKYQPIGEEKKEKEEYSNYQKTDCIEIRAPKEVMRVSRTKSKRGSPPFSGPSLYDIYQKSKQEAKPYLWYMVRPGHDLVDSTHLPYLVMPTPFKSLSAMRFAELNLVWQLLSRAVENAERIVSIGFTFYDQHFNAILASATMKSKRAKQLIVVSPRASTINGIAERLKIAAVHVEPFCGTFADYAAKAFNTLE